MRGGHARSLDQPEEFVSEDEISYRCTPCQNTLREELELKQWLVFDGWDNI